MQDTSKGKRPPPFVFEKASVLQYVSFRFVSFRSVSFRFVSFRFILFRFVLFVSFRFAEHKKKVFTHKSIGTRYYIDIMYILILQETSIMMLDPSSGGNKLFAGS